MSALTTARVRYDRAWALAENARLAEVHAKAARIIATQECQHAKQLVERLERKATP